MPTTAETSMAAILFFLLLCSFPLMWEDNRAKFISFFTLERDFRKAVDYYSQFGYVKMKKDSMLYKGGTSDTVYKIEYRSPGEPSGYLVRHADLGGSDNPLKEEQKAIRHLKKMFVNKHKKLVTTLTDGEILSIPKKSHES